MKADASWVPSFYFVVLKKCFRSTLKLKTNSQDCQGPGQCQLTARWKWFYRASATTWPGADPVLELLLEARQCFFWARDQLYIEGASTGPTIFSTDKKKTIYSQPEAF